MTADEQERRRIRRERNKVAASKCRKKRKEHVKTLVEVIIQFAVFTLTSDRNLGMINDDLVSSYCRLACRREVGKKQE